MYLEKLEGIWQEVGCLLKNPSFGARHPFMYCTEVKTDEQAKSVEAFDTRLSMHRSLTAYGGELPDDLFGSSWRHASVLRFLRGSTTWEASTTHAPVQNSGTGAVGRGSTL